MIQCILCFRIRWNFPKWSYDSNIFFSKLKKHYFKSEFWCFTSAICLTKNNTKIIAHAFLFDGQSDFQGQTCGPHWAQNISWISHDLPTASPPLPHPNIPTTMVGCCFPARCLCRDACEISQCTLLYSVAIFTMAIIRLLRFCERSTQKVSDQPFFTYIDIYKTSGVLSL